MLSVGIEGLPVKIARGKSMLKDPPQGSRLE